MTIVQIVQTIAGQLTGGFTFLHGRHDFNNLEDDVTFPVVYLDEPITSTDALHQTGFIEASYPIRLFFGKKSGIDFKPNDHQPLIDAMRNSAREFLIRCQNANDLIRFVRNAKRTDIINIFDVNITGCILEVELVPRDDQGICT